MLICAYCTKVIRDDYMEGQMSHGICPECSSYYIQQLKGLTVDQYLTQYEIPIVIVETEGRILAANEQAKAMVGKPDYYQGLLGGQFMECVHSRLPLGCGKTEHCSSCTIRGAVQKAMAGQDSYRVPAYLLQGSRRIDMLISAKKIKDELVTLQIDEITKIEEN